MLRATLELIASGGVAAVTNRRVATTAGVSLGSLTYHFTSQAQLLRESLLLYVEEETARREQIARELAAEKPGVERVAGAIRRSRRHPFGDPPSAGRTGAAPARRPRPRAARGVPPVLSSP